MDNHDQYSPGIPVNKKSYNIDDVVKRVDELEKENKKLNSLITIMRESLKIVELTLTENGIYL